MKLLSVQVGAAAAGTGTPGGGEAEDRAGTGATEIRARTSREAEGGREAGSRTVQVRTTGRINKPGVPMFTFLYFYPMCKEFLKSIHSGQLLSIKFCFLHFQALMLRL